jgi:hypothetical protein
MQCWLGAWGVLAPSLTNKPRSRSTVVCFSIKSPLCFARPRVLTCRMHVGDKKLARAGPYVSTCMGMSVGQTYNEEYVNNFDIVGGMGVRSTQLNTRVSPQPWQSR